MENQKPENLCESCGMPLTEKFISKIDNRYCVYCQDQEKGELKNYERVRAGCIDAAQRLMGKTEEEAIKMADEMLPILPRWKGKEN